MPYKTLRVNISKFCQVIQGKVKGRISNFQRWRKRERSVSKRRQAVLFSVDRLNVSLPFAPV